jgi:hypothetical protein
MSMQAGAHIINITPGETYEFVLQNQRAGGHHGGAGA